MPDEQPRNIFEELRQLSFRRQQMIDKRNMLVMLIQFKQNNGQNEQQYSRETEELQEIDEHLNILTEKKLELERLQERSGGNYLNTTVSSAVRPPDFPAPEVILNPEDFTRKSAQTQCPFCHQFISTDVTTKAGSATYIACLISILFCCIAGCCLIPFCLDGCKDVVHKCPKCRSHITTCEKL